MEISVDREQSSATLHLDGRFDAHEVGAIRAEIDGLVEQGYTTLVLDLFDVAFIDSKALALLVQVMKRCREAAGDLILTRLSQPVAIILELTKLDRAFTIVESTTQLAS